MYIICMWCLYNISIFIYLYIMISIYDMSICYIYVISRWYRYLRFECFDVRLLPFESSRMLRHRRSRSDGHDLKKSPLVAARARDRLMIVGRWLGLFPAYKLPISSSSSAFTCNIFQHRYIFMDNPQHSPNHPSLRAATACSWGCLQVTQCLAIVAWLHGDGCMLHHLEPETSQKWWEQGCISYNNHQESAKLY